MEIDIIDSFNLSRVSELESWVLKAREAYYNGTPIATDELFDSRVKELSSLRADSPAVLAVGAPVPISSWVKVAHSIPMGSLDKVQTPEDMKGWVGKTTDSSTCELLITEKLDGISISVRYEDGEYRQAITRGDGTIGEDITQNVIKMKGISRRLTEGVSAWFRGEIILLKADLKAHFPEQSNCRNTASGTSKRFDGRGCEHLTVLFYQILEGPEITTESEQFRLLKRLGLAVPEWSLVDSGADSVCSVWKEYQKNLRDNLPYDIDGLVVRLNDLASQWSKGERNGRPLGAIAFKFPSLSKETLATGRIDQVGGTGRITPVAVFDPVNILGAEITRASLYNQSYIEQIGFDIGAKILVSRANDVIPRVEGVITPTGKVSSPPKNCPECGAETEQDGEYIVCPNTGGCPAQTEGRIRQWVKELGILEWGSTLIEKVVGAGLVKSVPDLYRLSETSLASLERMGETSARNAIENLWRVSILPLEQILGALSIPLCATSTMSLVIDSGFDNLEKIRAASVNHLQGIPGMGPKRAEALYDWLQCNSALLDELLEVGIKIRTKCVGPLTGKSVCFTGKSELKRSILEQMTKEAGGVVKKSVVVGLTYLVMSDPESGSSKAQAAKKMGIKCISERQFREIVVYQ